MKTMKRLKHTFTQRGVSLLEMMIAMAISLVVSLAMVLLMSNTLSTGTDTIGMARLGNDMRAAMQIMSRDLRRANFHANFAQCFGNWNCRTTLDAGGSDASAYIRSIQTGNSVGTNDCFWYWFDRDMDGDVTDDDDVGAFRRSVVNGVGVIQMTTTRNTLPSCNSGTYWVDLTDSDLIDITNFSISNALAYTDTIVAGTVNQRVDKIILGIQARLVRNNAIQRTLTDVIRVRNDIYSAP